jgi:hypothetical protein
VLYRTPRSLAPYLIATGNLKHQLIAVKRMLDQLGSEQKELYGTLRLAHLRGDLLHLLPPGNLGGYELPGGVLLNRRPGRKQWTYSPAMQKLEAQLKAQQVYEQANGQAAWSLGTETGAPGTRKSKATRLTMPS